MLFEIAFCLGTELLEERSGTVRLHEVAKAAMQKP